MLTEICQYIRNWFEVSRVFGTFKITDGVLTDGGGMAPLSFGQYYRVVGSMFNDGVHQMGSDDTTLVDEEFTGAVWIMAIPPSFLALVKDIESWCTANRSVIDSPYQSESFGGYSYTKGGAAQGATWQGQFYARLSPWRKL